MEESRLQLVCVRGRKGGRAGEEEEGKKDRKKGDEMGRYEN